LIYLPAQLRPLVETAVHTGMRLGELLNLTWAQVDLEHRLILIHESKNNQRRQVLPNSVASEVLAKLPRFLNSPYVFCQREGLQLKPRTVEYIFSEALKRAGITDFRFHDLRHTFASWLVMRGVDLKTIQELLGHKDYHMTLRYAHLSPVHKRATIEKLADNTSLPVVEK
jgi:integrase